MAPMRSISMLLTTAPFAVALGGCATSDEGPFAWSEGWRKGEVVEVVKPADMERPRFYKCAREADAQEFKSDFVVVKYLERGRAKRTAVPAPPGQRMQQGDYVYVNLGDCRLPAVARASR